MIKKMVSFLVLFCVLISSSFAGVESDLKSVIDDFNYSMTVEWDQNDKDFHDEQVQKLKASLETLKAQGLSNDDMMNFVVGQIQNKRIAQDAVTVYEMTKANRMSSADAELIIRELLKESNAKGASFSGEPKLKYIGVILLCVAMMFTLGYANSDFRYNH